MLNNKSFKKIIKILNKILNFKLQKKKQIKDFLIKKFLMKIKNYYLKIVMLKIKQSSNQLLVTRYLIKKVIIF